MNQNPQDDHVESPYEEARRLAPLASELADMRKLVQDDEPGKGLMDGFKAQDLRISGTELSAGELERMAQGGPGQVVAIRPAVRDAIIPGTALTVAAVERLENAAANLVAMANLCVAGPLDQREIIPEVLKAPIAKINAILAGPGPVALDRRPNSVEVVNNPELHERALIEARAREAARTGFNAETLAQSDGYEEAQHAHLQDVAQAFEEGKTQGYTHGFQEAEAIGKALAVAHEAKGYDAGKADTVMIYNGAYDDGYGDARRDVRTMSLWALVRFWLNGKGAPMPSHAGKVGGINTDSSSYWKNNAEMARLQKHEPWAGFHGQTEGIDFGADDPFRSPPDPGAPKDPCSPSQ